MNSFKFKKAVQALNYFAQKEGGELNYMKAGKLVWLSDRMHVRIYGRTITNDQYFAMKKGPVASGTKDIIFKSAFFEQEVIDYSNKFLSEVCNYNINSIAEPDTSVFSKTDLKVMDKTYEDYGKYDQYELSEYSHRFLEWKRYQIQLEKGIAKSFPIQQIDFFDEGYKDAFFAQSSELLALSKERFQEIV